MSIRRLLHGASRIGGWVVVVLAGAALLTPGPHGVDLAGNDGARLVLSGMLGVCLAAQLVTVVEGRRDTAAPRLTGAAVIAGVGLWVLLPYDRVAAPLAMRGPGGVATWLLCAVACFALARRAAQPLERELTVDDVLHVVGVAGLTVFCVALTALHVFPGSIPDIVTPGQVSGDGLATAVQVARGQSAIEAVDAYVLPLVLATLALLAQAALATARTLGLPRPLAVS
jgi:hypothetical protein